MGPSEATAGKRVFAGATYLGMVLNFGMDPEEIAANAEPWADAPRLLEVLRNLLAYAEIPQSWDGIGEAEQAFTQAHEMLEKHCG
jgi:hypothetical protein